MRTACTRPYEPWRRNPIPWIEGGHGALIPWIEGGHGALILITAWRSAAADVQLSLSPNLVEGFPPLFLFFSIDRSHIQLFSFPCHGRGSVSGETIGWNLQGPITFASFNSLAAAACKSWARRLSSRLPGRGCRFVARTFHQTFEVIQAWNY